MSNYGYIKIVSIEYKGTNHNTLVGSTMEINSTPPQSFVSNPTYNKLKYLHVNAWEGTFSGTTTTVNVGINITSGGNTGTILIPVKITSDGKNIHYRKVVRIPNSLNPSQIAVFYLHVESKGRPAGITEFRRIKSETGMFVNGKSNFGAPRQASVDNVAGTLFPAFYSAAASLANVWSVPATPYNAGSSFAENSRNLQIIISGLDLAWNDLSGATEVTIFNTEFSNLLTGFDQLRDALVTNLEYPGHEESDMEWPGVFSENIDEEAECICTFFQLYNTFPPTTKAKLDTLQTRINDYYAMMLAFTNTLNYGEMIPPAAVTPCDKIREIKRFLPLYKAYYENEGNF